MVITTFDTRADLVEMVKTNIPVGARVRFWPVHRIDIALPPILHYKGMLTKLYAWRLEEYSKIMYVDSDIVFLKNPVDAVTFCGDELMCAAVDQPTNGNHIIPYHIYFMLI